MKGESLWDLRDNVTKCSIYVIGSPGGEKKECGIQKVIIENFTSVVKDIYIYRFKKLRKSWKMIISKDTIHRHIIIEYWKSKKTFSSSQRKTACYINGHNDLNDFRLLIRNNGAKGTWTTFFKVWKEKIVNPDFNIKQKYSWGMKVFSDEGKLKSFTKSRPPLK